MKAPEKRFEMKAFTGFAIGTLAVLGAVAAVFIYLKKKTTKISMTNSLMMTMKFLILQR